nr:MULTISPECIES: hypothetical protein [unclassified Streptomyces]
MPDHLVHDLARIAVRTRGHQHLGGAAHQRAQQLPAGHVERGGRLLENPVRGAEPVRLAHPQQPVAQGAGGDDDALGLAGGAGGEQDVGRVVVGDIEERHPRRRGHRAHQIHRVQAQHPYGVLLAAVQAVRRLPGDQREPRPRTAQNAEAPLARVLRGQWKIGQARLQRAEQRAHQGAPARHTDGHDVPRAATGPGQQPGDRVGGGLQLGVRDRPRRVDERHGVRRGGGDGPDEPRHAVGRRAVPVRASQDRTAGLGRRAVHAHSLPER